MPVRKTESRLPFDFLASDLGQAVLSSDNKIACISFVSSPLVVGRENIYVVFVTDTTLASSVERFEWGISENSGAASTEMTDFGEFAYTPLSTGELSVTVRLLGSGDSELASVSINQNIVALHDEIETLINDAADSVEPGIGNPDVARELVNDHSPYYQDILMQAPESDESFQRFVYSMTYDGALRKTPTQRKEHVTQIKNSLNTQDLDFQTVAGEGAGICGIRLALLAMVIPQSPGGSTMLLNWTEIPEAPNQRLIESEQLLESLSNLEEEKRLDLFNLVRFPKSNISQCARIIETLRDHYFSGVSFNDVMTGLSGTRAHWIVRHYREGPLRRE